MGIQNSYTSFSLPPVGRVGVGVAPTSKIEKESFSKPMIPSDAHPNPPHKGEGTFCYSRGEA